jgi:hypothetical protein
MVTVTGLWWVVVVVVCAVIATSIPNSTKRSRRIEE